MGQLKIHQFHFSWHAEEFSPQLNNAKIRVYIDRWSVNSLNAGGWKSLTFPTPRPKKEQRTSQELISVSLRGILQLAFDFFPYNPKGTVPHLKFEPFEPLLAVVICIPQSRACPSGGCGLGWQLCTRDECWLCARVA